MADKTYLDKVYDLSTPDETRALYDQWSDSYDDEVLENGYVTPIRVARALAAQVKNLDRAVLDFGCGTGLSGAALIQTGFTTVDGADLSAEMLTEAREKGVYRDLWQVHPGGELPFDPGRYHAITASGVIGSGAAPPETFDLLMENLAPQGLLAFSFNDHTLSDPEYEGRMRSWIEEGKAHVLFQEHGDHLPKIGLKATVYVLEKA
ncbi:class I SAM-dependent methyltransferase [Pseudoruegeria sp. HB172150]|uniref:class I SAM-dependent DNA methyltransferase n=1 Tax=Pseudoruegeria sp. HB172150 TaxID=2721164 RepID=UPI00155500BB|nr:methyltransferase domain-containing protein [Pseudoruegeria sp. HB172150]